ncbi:hypothetical protein [Proteus vulgaris]|uniref:hypothetical protein n=1 Tax=Proteus vulgaris TaxID=585 RepID=UPI001E38FD8F|nr:hypothetical protein [Proteus vulgaris]
MVFFISYMTLAILLIAILAHWSFSVLFPKAPPTTLSCLLVRTLIGVLLVIADICLIFILLSQLL